MYVFGALYCLLQDGYSRAEMCNIRLGKCSIELGYSCLLLWIVLYFLNSFHGVHVNVNCFFGIRVQQITGVTNNMQRRSGDVLPPPADDYCNNSSVVTVKPIVKASSNVRLLVTWKTFFSSLC